MLRFLANREISESKIDSRGARRRQSQVGDVQYGGSREDDGGLDGDYEPLIPDMLENGVRGMIYAGESDFICNFAGNLDWTRKMEWSGREEFAKKFSSPFVIDEEEGWTGGEVIENDDGRSRS